jgi:membrane-associated protease RseP (regulator of RpoE activity)
MNNLRSLKETNIASYIYFIRGEKVMLDVDLANLYEVETRALKQSVKRNIDRFPKDFMFQLTVSEWKELITNCDNLGAFKFSPALPFAFTEQGVAMLSGILKGERAVSVNIAIMRTFVKLRQLIQGHKDLISKIDKLEEKYDNQFRIVFTALKQLIREDNKPRPRIGFKK